jgi:hypothetical protein
MVSPPAVVTWRAAVSIDVTSVLSLRSIVAWLYKSWGRWGSHSPGALPGL